MGRSDSFRAFHAVKGIRVYLSAKLGHLELRSPAARRLPLHPLKEDSLTDYRLWALQTALYASEARELPALAASRQGCLCGRRKLLSHPDLAVRHGDPGSLESSDRPEKTVLLFCPQTQGDLMGTTRPGRMRNWICHFRRLNHATPHARHPSPCRADWSRGPTTPDFGLQGRKQLIYTLYSNRAKITLCTSKIPRELHLVDRANFSRLWPRPLVRSIAPSCRV